MVSNNDFNRRLETSATYASCDWFFSKHWHVFRAMVNTVEFTGYIEFNDY